MDGRWNGHVLAMVEAFRFADGGGNRKTWPFAKRARAKDRGTRRDVRGDRMVPRGDGLSGTAVMGR